MNKACEHTWVKRKELNGIIMLICEKCGKVIAQSSGIDRRFKVIKFSFIDILIGVGLIAVGCSCIYSVWKMISMGYTFDTMPILGAGVANAVLCIALGLVFLFVGFLSKEKAL